MQAFVTVSKDTREWSELQDIQTSVVLTSPNWRPDSRIHWEAPDLAGITRHAAKKRIRWPPLPINLVVSEHLNFQFLKIGHFLGVGHSRVGATFAGNNPVLGCVCVCVCVCSCILLAMRYQMFQECCPVVQILVDISAPKKKMWPPPPIPQFDADTLPAPRPLLLLETPLLGFAIKNRQPLPSASDFPFPLPEQKKIKNIRNVHQEILDNPRELDATGTPPDPSSSHRGSRGEPWPDAEPWQGRDSMLSLESALGGYLLLNSESMRPWG